MSGWSTWIPGFVALAVGLLGGGWAVWVLRRRADGDARATSAVDLDERARQAIQTLRDLDEQRGRMHEDTYTQERARLEGVAADALRSRDAVLAKNDAREKAPVRAPGPNAGKSAGTRAQVASAGAADGFWARNPQLKGFAWGAGTVAVGVLLYALVERYSAPRGEGDSMTGNTSIAGPMRGGPGGGADAAGEEDGDAAHAMDPEVRALMDRVERDPQDAAALLGLTRLMLRQGAFEQAKVLLERARQVDPKNPEGRVYGAVLQAAGGDLAGGTQTIDAVLVDNPTFAEAWFFKGMLAMQAGQHETVRQAWTKYVEVAPDSTQKERIAGFLRGEGMGMPGSGAPPSGDMAAASAPGDLHSMLEEAKGLLRRQSFAEARVLIERALALDPKNGVARVYAAVLKSGQGDADGALAGIDLVLAEQPNLPDAWFFRGMLGMQSGKPELARESWEKFVAVAPEGPQKERIKGFLAGEGLQMPR